MKLRSLICHADELMFSKYIEYFGLLWSTPQIFSICLWMIGGYFEFFENIVWEDGRFWLASSSPDREIISELRYSIDTVREEYYSEMLHRFSQMGVTFYEIHHALHILPDSKCLATSCCHLDQDGICKDSIGMELFSYCFFCCISDLSYGCTLIGANFVQGCPWYWIELYVHSMAYGCLIIIHYFC